MRRLKAKLWIEERRHNEDRHQGEEALARATNSGVLPRLLQFGPQPVSSHTLLNTKTIVTVVTSDRVKNDGVQTT